MLFNSYIFILLFLPLCLIGYFLINRSGKTRLGLAYLFGMSLWFYGANTPVYLVLIVSSVLVNYCFYMLSKKAADAKNRRLLKILAVTLNLAVLFCFKYFDFFISTVNSVLGSGWNLKHIILPLGISFFTFQQISFVVDAFNGEVADYGFIEYACFVTFFPQLVAGPIVTHDELVPQLCDESKKRFNWESFSRGVYIFAMGLAKKVLIADNLSGMVTFLYFQQTPMVDSLSCFVVAIVYTLQLYMDFSGYSDMAIGIGKMFNIDLPQNFDSPHKAENIDVFWKRWHITLTRFFRKYVYFPLGGSRKGTAFTCLNILIVYFLSGLWHGANWTFVIWGLLHGVACVIYRLGRRGFDRIPKPIGRTLTFLFVAFCLVIFRANNVSQGFAIIKHIFDFDFSGGVALLSYCMDFGELRILLSSVPVLGGFLSDSVVSMFVFIIFVLCLVFIPKNAYEKMQQMRPNLFHMLTSSALIVWCLLSFGKVSEFLYFNF